MNTYTKSWSYENFIRRAFKCTADELEAHNSNMQNLLDAEDGKGFDFLPTQDVQLKIIKKNIEKAFNKFSLMKLTNEEKQKFSDLKSQCLAATSGYELCEFLDEALEVTQRLK